MARNDWKLHDQGYEGFILSERKKTEQRPILYLKIFGERNTGSNYLHQVCTRNFLAVMLRGDIQEIWGLGRKIAGQMVRGVLMTTNLSEPKRINAREFITFKIVLFEDAHRPCD